MDGLDQARAFVQGRVDFWLASAPTTKRGPNAEAIWWRLGFEYVEAEAGKYIVCYENGLPTLYEMAMIHEDVRQLFAQKVGSKLSAGVPLATTERTFAAMHLTGSLPEIHRRPGRKSTDNFARNMFLQDVVLEISQIYDLRPTRNDVSSDRTSVCDLVSDAFIARGRHEITYRTVKEVWADKELRSFQDDLRPVILAQASERKRHPFNGTNALARYAMDPAAPFKV